MAFCTKCGRALNNGEICNCQTNTNTQGNQNGMNVPPVQMGAQKAQSFDINKFSMGFWQLIMGLIKTPVTTINNFIDKPNMSYAFTLVGIKAFIIAFTAWISQLIFNMSHIYAQYSVSEIAGRFFDNILGNVAAPVLSALVIMIVMQALTKQKTSFSPCMCAVALSIVYTVPARLISQLLSYINISFFAELGGWIASFSSAAGAILVFFGIRAICKKEDSVPIVAGCCAAATAFAFYIVGLMFQL